MKLSSKGQIGVIFLAGIGALGLRYVWLTPVQMAQCVLHGAYWVLLLLVIFFLLNLYRACFFSRFKIWIVKQGWVIFLLFGLLLLLILHERFLFKINYDEHVLLSISRSMHFEHIAGWQADGRIFSGSLTTTTFVADKRPVLYPFLLSIVHNVTGYRLINAYILNVILAGFILLGAYRLGWKLGGKSSGLLLASLLAGVPLIAQNATGGGFELLNIMLIIWLAVSVWDYLHNPDQSNITLVGFLSILLANTRYESLIYCIVPFVCIATNFLQRRICNSIPWIVIFIPLAVTPALFANGIFNSTEAFFQMTRSEFWNIANYRSNLEHAVAYLFDPDRGGTNSLFLAASGLLASICTPFMLRSEYIQLGPTKWIGQWVHIIMGVFILFNTMVILGLGWGQWDDALVSRFTLPLWFLFAWNVTYVVSKLTKNYSLPVSNIACKITFLYMLVFATADASGSKATNKLKPAFLLARSLEFIKTYDPWRQTLVVAGSALPYLNEGYPAVTFQSGLKIAPAVNFQLYENVLIVLHYKRNAANGDWMGDISMKPFEAGVFQNLKEFQLDPFNRIVIAKIISLPKDFDVNWVSSSESESEDKYVRRIYKMLP
jgi:hypothetical protein